MTMSIEVNPSPNVHGVLRCTLSRPAWYAAALWITVAVTGTTPATFASVIDFESQCPSGAQPSGPCSMLFSTVGNAQSLNIPTAIGTATATGGAILDHITN